MCAESCPPASTPSLPPHHAQAAEKAGLGNAADISGKVNAAIGDGTALKGALGKLGGGAAPTAPQ